MKEILILGRAWWLAPAALFAQPVRLPADRRHPSTCPARGNWSRPHPRGQVVELDVADLQATERLVAASDVVVSLLPAPMNPSIAPEPLHPPPQAPGQHLLRRPRDRGLDERRGGRRAPAV